MPGKEAEHFYTPFTQPVTITSMGLRKEAYLFFAYRIIAAQPFSRIIASMIIEVDDRNKQKPEEFSFDKDEIIVGRGKDCDLRITADGISRQHVKITKAGDKVTIEDLGSSNGTFINEKKIQKEEFTTFFPATLGYGVILTLRDI